MSEREFAYYQQQHEACGTYRVEQERQRELQKAIAPWVWMAALSPLAGIALLIW